MKDHEIREFTNELTAAARKYEGCQCLRSGISKVVDKYIPRETAKDFPSITDEQKEWVRVIKPL